MSNNPPQLQLSLGHPAFKRSFHQFGLDVDDAEDSEVGASGSSGSGSGGSASGSGSGSGGSRSVSSGSSYSSQAADSYGYNGGEGNERNKRARSEGPDGANAVGVVSSPGSVGNSSGASYTTARSGAGDFQSLSQELSEEQTAPQAYTRSDLPSTAAYQQSYEGLNGFTLPPFHFGPSTPSVAEFAASRSNILNTRTAEQPPGFAGMLSPRSSSPAPPPIDGLGLDVAMHDEQEEDEDNEQVDVDVEPFRSLASRITQNPSSSTFLDTARSDALLNSATERLRSAMERARSFERTLAPLRSDTSDGVLPSSQALPRPRLPSFDFESHDRALSPQPYRDGTAALISAPSNPFDRQRNRLRNVTAAARSTSSPRRRRRSPEPDRISFSVSDDLEVENQLGLDFDLHGSHSQNSNISTTGSAHGSRSSNHSSASTGSTLADLLDERERSLGALTDRTIDDLTRFISRSENEDDARPRTFFDTSELDHRLSGDSINDSSRSHSFSRAQASPAASPTASRDLSNNFLPEFYGQSAAVRPISHPNPAWERSLHRGQTQAERGAASADRTQAWSLSQPWLSENEDLLPRQGPSGGSEARTESHLSSRSQQAQPQLPSFSYSSLLGSRPNLTELDAESNTNRIERMVRLDMGMDVRSHSQSRNRGPPVTSHTREEGNNLSRSPSATSWRLSPLLPSAPPTNLPTLRSALRNVEAFENLLGEESEEDANAGAPYTSASASAVSPSMSGAGLRARASITRGPRIEHESARSNAPEAANRSRELLARAQAERDRMSQSMRNLPNLYSNMPSRLLSDTSEWSRLPRINDGLTDNDSQSTDLLSALYSQHRDLARREDEHRRTFDRLSAISQEEGRARDSELTRLRELRERNRISLRSRLSPAERTERANSFIREMSNFSRSTDAWNSAPPSAPSRFAPNSGLTPSAGVTTAPRFTPQYLSPEGGPGNSSGNSISTSTEAAAYFASDPSHGPPRPPHERPYNTMLRQRRLRLLSDFEESSRPDAREGLWDDFDLNLDPTDTYGFGGNWRRSPSPISRPERAPNSSSDDLLRLLYPNRPAQNEGSPVQPRNELGPIDAQASRRPSDEFEFNDLPPLEDSRTGTWNFHRLSHRNQDAGAARPTQRGNARSASRPPSLPPLRFDRLSAMATGRESEGPGGRALGSEEPSPAHVSPWRRSISRLDEYPVWRGSNRSAMERPELAMHYALTLQSVHARHPTARGLENDHDRSSNAQGEPESSSRPPARSQGFQHAMDVLGGDGLSNTRRQQFSSAYERENDRNQARTRPPRIETHVRWGEFSGDDADGRPSAHSPHSWAESVRNRRRSPSLFAPPPENADNAPPNRNRGIGTAAGNQNSSSQTSGAPHDWFSMISASRARARARARAGRTEDEPGPRSFFRFGRNRAGLRNLGDFVRDEDFDSSYENLIALATTLGDVKPRATPAHVLNSLPTGLFKDWQSAGCDARCPICLDDYKDMDPVLKAEPCHHWCHKECLEQWLHTAQTCPVCRTKIRSSQDPATPPPTAGPSGLNRVSQSTADNIEEAGDDSDDDFSFLTASPARMNRALFEVLRSNGTLAPSPPP